MPDYDLVVIGSGPAGEKGAVQAAYFGGKVALIEKEPVLGGASANTGTIPSKTLRETALFLSQFRSRDLYGVNVELKREASVDDLLYRERRVRETERERIRQNLERHNVTVYQGTAAFVDKHTVVIRGANGREDSITSGVFLIATGSSPNRPPPYPFEDERIYDSDELLTLHEIPASMAVVGGGVIGCEYACMFAAIGVRVTLLEQRDRVMPFLDAEIALALQERMARLGVEMALGDAVESLELGSPLVHLKLKSGRLLDAAAVFVAAGRNSNSRGMGLEKIGVQLEAKGRIVVNDNYQTAVPHIYAAGDVIGFPALASTSMEQARIAICHAFDLKYKSKLAPILPYGVYTIPEVSMAGDTEEQLQERKEDYVVGRASFARNPRGEIIGESHGMVKLLFRRNDMRLLGVHIIGEQASELIHMGLTALLVGATSDLFIQTCFNYPTLSEAYKYAAYDALGRRGQ